MTGRIHHLLRLRQGERLLIALHIYDTVLVLLS